MARNFSTVLEQIKKVAPERLREKLEHNVCFWAPENCWYNLTEYVNKYVELCSTDPVAVSVYAILCDCSEEEMKKRMEKDGF